MDEQPLWVRSCRCALASFRGQPREQSPWGEGIVCTKCLSLPEACRSPGHGPLLAGTHLPCAGRTEGALSDPIHQGIVGAPQAPLAQGSASSPSAWGGGVASVSLLSGPAAGVPCLLPFHVSPLQQPSPASFPIHISPLQQPPPASFPSHVSPSWTARRSNHSILGEISPEFSLEPPARGSGRALGTWS